MSKPDDGIPIDMATTTTPSRIVKGSAIVELTVGSRVGDYIVDRVLGSGGSARVYEAHHPVLGRRVALKVLHPEFAGQNEMVARFIREAQVVNRIAHPHVADVYDFGLLDDHRPYYVMEYIDGPNLSRLILERGRLPITDVALVLEQLASALGAANRAGVVHRDVKGSNVVVLPGEPLRVKLLDFGIAKLLHPEPGEVPLTTERQALGSPPYMPPEQIRGLGVDGRADIYSLGVLIYLASTGTMPFYSQSTVELVRMHLEVDPAPPTSLASIPGALDAVILKALAKDPEQRWQTVEAFAAAFREAVSGPVVGASPVGSRTALGVGVCVEAHFPEDVSDQTLETATAVLGEIEAEFDALDYQPFLQTGNLLLMVMVLADDPTDHGPTIRVACAFAERLHQLHGERLRALGVRLTIFIHVDQVTITLRGQRVAVTGGPLTQSADWPITAEHGWYATAPAFDRTR